MGRYGGEKMRWSERCDTHGRGLPSRPRRVVALLGPIACLLTLTNAVWGRGQPHTVGRGGFPGIWFCRPFPGGGVGARLLLSLDWTWRCHPGAAASEWLTGIGGCDGCGDGSHGRGPGDRGGAGGSDPLDVSALPTSNGRRTRRPRAPA